MTDKNSVISSVLQSAPPDAARFARAVLELERAFSSLEAGPAGGNGLAMYIEKDDRLMRDTTLLYMVSGNEVKKARISSDMASWLLAKGYAQWRGDGK